MRIRAAIAMIAAAGQETGPAPDTHGPNRTGLSVRAGKPGRLAIDTVRRKLTPDVISRNKRMGDRDDDNRGRTQRDQTNWWAGSSPPGWRQPNCAPCTWVFTLACTGR